VAPNGQTNPRHHSPEPPSRPHALARWDTVHPENPGNSYRPEGPDSPHFFLCYLGWKRSPVQACHAPEPWTTRCRSGSGQAPWLVRGPAGPTIKDAGGSW